MYDNQFKALNKFMCNWTNVYLSGHKGEINFKNRFFQDNTSKIKEVEFASALPV